MVQGATNLEGELDYGNVCFTTTDIGGALNITGLTVQKARLRPARGPEGSSDLR